MHVRFGECRAVRPDPVDFLQLPDPFFLLRRQPVISGKQVVTQLCG